MMGEFSLEIIVLLFLTVLIIPFGFVIKKTEDGPYKKGLFFVGFTFFLKKKSPDLKAKREPKETGKKNGKKKGVEKNEEHSFIKYRKWMDGPLFWSVLKLAFKMIRRCYLSVSINIKHTVLIYGFQDPFKTGRACALVSIISSQLPKSFKLIPNFETGVFDLRGELIFKTRLLSFVIMMVEMLVNIPYKIIYRIYRKRV